MPHLTIPILPLGPLIDLAIGVSKPREDALKKAGAIVPPPITTRALIDTGASLSAVDATLVKALGLTPTGSAKIHTGSSGNTAHSCDLYDLSIIIPPAAPNLRIAAVQVTEIKLSGQGHSFLVLIGRDILANCLMVYDGKNKQLILAF